MPWLRGALCTVFGVYLALAVTVRNGCGLLHCCQPVCFALSLLLALLCHLLKPAGTGGAFALLPAHAGYFFNLALGPAKFVHCLHFSSPICRAFIGRTANPSINQPCAGVCARLVISGVRALLVQRFRNLVRCLAVEVRRMLFAIRAVHCPIVAAACFRVAPAPVRANVVVVRVFWVWR